MIRRDDRPGTSADTIKSVSKNYVARMDVNGHRIALIGIHYLSRPLDQSRLDPRQAQADATSNQARELADAGYSVIILGDINDFAGEEAALDINDHLPITDVMARLQGMDPATPMMIWSTRLRSYRRQGATPPTGTVTRTRASTRRRSFRRSITS